MTKANRVSKEEFEAMNTKVNQNIYTNRNWIVRELFWRRLDKLLSLTNLDNKVVMDFGCGEGALLPTLSELSKEVYGVDIKSEAAEELVSRYKLKNVQVVSADLREPLYQNMFDVVICADVLEHFKQMGEAIATISIALKEDGFLLVSAPTENFFYRIGRRVFGFVKPPDHYYNSLEITKYLKENGYYHINRYGYPFKMPYSFSAFELMLFSKHPVAKI